jgi:FkbM family methyltransferase
MHDISIKYLAYDKPQEKIISYDTPFGLVHDFLYRQCSSYHIIEVNHLNPNNKITMYSQGAEEQKVVDFFKDFKGRLLEIGANHGITFSNSKKLIELGWEAVLVEPSPECIDKLKALHLGNERVKIEPSAIDIETGEKEFHESGALIGPGIENENNLSLVSTLIPSEKERWNPLKMKWKNYKVNTLNWLDFTKLHGDTFDFVSIDAEGLDLQILKQMDLNKIKLLCIEWNSILEIKEEILKYTSQFGMNKVIYQTGENLIICK